LAIVQFNLSQLFLEFKQNQKALPLLLKLENVRPGDVEILYSLSLIYSRIGEYEKALLTLSKLNSDTAKRADFAGVYAYNLLKTNQLSEANIVIEKRSSATDSEEYNVRNKILENEISTKLKEQNQKTK
jgi:tetratricopeptide (TPR) repeat protein